MEIELLIIFVLCLAVGITLLVLALSASSEKGTRADLVYIGNCVDSCGEIPKMDGDKPVSPFAARYPTPVGFKMPDWLSSDDKLKKEMTTIGGVMTGVGAVGVLLLSFMLYRKFSK